MKDLDKFFKSKVSCTLFDARFFSRAITHECKIPALVSLAGNTRVFKIIIPSFPIINHFIYTEC